ncbi:hypothetical protein [Clostridium botulinum]|uniref:hypothetical protein n=1 Tax=Clostridium botulinum TaxID=1491 RepID=UPI001748F46F|nr:hypothetical protein [Clostridium botulinum]MBD5589179.1 hypothetical protein [Clostridium botulinum]
MASKPKMKCHGKCQSTKSVDLFYKSQSPKHEVFGGYCPYCKDCLKKLVYQKGIFDVEKLKFVLKHYLDKPFFNDVLESAMTVNTSNHLGTYLKQLNLKKQVGRDTMTWKDGETGEKIETEKKNSKKQEVFNQDNLYTKEELFALQNRWGEGFEPKDYKYLEEQYLDLGKHYKSEDSYAMQLIFEEACLTRLTIKKKREKGDDVNKELKTLQDLLGSANIKPNQETSAENIEKGSFGVFIKKIEDEEPIPDWEKDLGKEDKIKKYIRIFYFGNLAKALGIPNPWIDEFEKEMKEFTVDKSEVEKDEEDLLGD